MKIHRADAGGPAGAGNQRVGLGNQRRGPGIGHRLRHGKQVIGIDRVCEGKGLPCAISPGQREKG